MSIFKKIKISQLPAAGTAQSGDVYPTVQGGETRKQSQSAVVQNAEQIAANALSAATAALNALPSKSDKATAATGNVGLAVSEVHGSRANPLTDANITVNITGAELDPVSRVYHQAASAPNINVSGTGAGVATKYGDGIYDPSKVNIIGFWYDGDGNVGYGILPEQ